MKLYILFGNSFIANVKDLLSIDDYFYDENDICDIFD